MILPFEFMFRYSVMHHFSHQLNQMSIYTVTEFLLGILCQYFHHYKGHWCILVVEVYAFYVLFVAYYSCLDIILNLSLVRMLQVVCVYVSVVIIIINGLQCIPTLHWKFLFKVSMCILQFRHSNYLEILIACKSMIMQASYVRQTVAGCLIRCQQYLRDRDYENIHENIGDKSNTKHPHAHNVYFNEMIFHLYLIANVNLQVQLALLPAFS